jgi:short-subunit dehydrogenase
MLYWGLSLTDELAAEQIQVLTVCPQRVDSAFFKKADPHGKRMPKRTPIAAKRIAEETFRALQEKQNLLVFSALDVVRVILMRPSLAWNMLKNTTLFRES